MENVVCFCSTLYIVSHCLQDLIGENAAAEFARSREHIRVLVDILTRLRDIAERLVSAASVYAADMQQLSKELRY